MSIAIHDEAKRLTHMINQYLDITRLESGATVLRRAAVRIEALVERTLLMLDPLASERGIRLTRHLDSNVTPVIADGDLLSRAISNLVSNAVKYSPPKTEVVISARNVANGVSAGAGDRRTARRVGCRSQFGCRFRIYAVGSVFWGMNQ
jgi:signal transduction histidine kinase